GEALAFLTAGPMHHELALQNVGPSAPSPPPRGTGLYHVAFEVPDRESLAAAYRKLTERGTPVHLVDHRISWAMYFSDPDGNGLELYWDTRSEADGVPLWHGSDRALTPERLLGDAGTQAPPR